MLPACDDKTLPQVQELHPAGDLNFNRQLWPDEDELRNYWASEGRQVLDTHFSVKKIRPQSNTFDAAHP